jgi:peptidoglycan-N-acetylglucosamine deacetylase
VQLLNYPTYCRYLLLAFVLLSLSSPLWAQTGDNAAGADHSPGAPLLTFGSQVVLDGCWSAAELHGTAVEKKPSPRQPLPAGPPLSPATCRTTLPPLPAELKNSIRSVTPADGRKLIALTFDLCEGPGECAGYDGEIVTFLRAAQVKATFFAGGKWLQSHPERAMQLMADPLFEIGNHSWNHPNFRLLSEPQMLAQILRTQGQYELLREKLSDKVQAQGIPVSEMAKIPQVPLIFRFPYGTCSHETLQVTSRLGLPAIQWSIVTADSWKLQTAEKIAKIVMLGARPGSIIIMHANGKGIHTARALALCVPQLQDLGYQFVTVSELLQAGTVVAATSCYEMIPNDNRRYDRLQKRN